MDRVAILHVLHDPRCRVPCREYPSRRRKMTFDAHFKQLIQDFLKQCEIQANDSVGKLPLAIDLVIKCLERNTSGIFIPIFKDNFSYINILEFKSSHDPPERDDLAKLVGYVGLYCHHHGIGLDEIPEKITAWYIVAGHPTYFADLVEKHTIKATSTRGLYQVMLPFLCPFFIIIIDELDITDGNFPLLGFATDETLKDSVIAMDEKRRRNALSPELEKYLTTICVINYGVLHTMTEMENILPDIFEKNLKLAINDIGLKKVIDAVGVKEVIDAIGMDRLFAELGEATMNQLFSKWKARKKN